MSTRFTLRGTAFCAVVLLSACYNPRYQHQITSFGNLDVARDKALAQKAEDLDWNADYSDIRVLVGSTPPGIQLEDGGSRIAIDAEQASRYTVLGTATSKAGNVNPSLLLFWYVPPHDSEGKFRKVWCAWQAPFRALTLGVFWKMVPFDWGCGPRNTGDPSLHERELRRMARAMGGNLVIVTGSIDRTYLNAAGAEVGRTQAIGMRAYVLKDGQHLPAARSVAYERSDRPSGQAVDHGGALHSPITHYTLPQRARW
jgi:hypothetical protein